MAAAAAVVLTACGGRTERGFDHFSSGEGGSGSGISGASGSTGISTGGAVAVAGREGGGSPSRGGTPSVTPDGGAPDDGAPEGGAPDVPGDVVTDARRVSGKGFTVDEPLCPPGISDGPRDGVSSLSSVYVRGAGNGSLDLVTYTRAGGAPVIEVHRLSRSGSGWKARDVVTGAWGEGNGNRVTTRTHVADELELIFRTPGDGRALELSLRARQPGMTTNARATLDVTPPELGVLSAYSDVVDGYGANDFSRYFVFSEPIASPSVSVRDRSGAPVPIKRLETNGYMWGFAVSDQLSSLASINGEVADLQGTEARLAEPYPGIDLEAIDGEFESELSFMDSDIWVGYDAPDCTLSGATTSPPSHELPPLAGRRSFFINGETSRCSVFFRVARGDSAKTRLVFSAAQIARESDEATDAGVKVCVSSLDVGNDRFCSLVTPGWVTDAARSAEGVTVSIPQSISISSLPLGVPDLWVEIQPSHSLWIDSLRFE